MDRRTLYEDDYFAWLQQQAAAVRRFAPVLREPPDGLAQIAEEVEDVGKSELRATRSFVRNLLIHLLLVAFDVGTPARLRWSAELRTFHDGFRSFATPSMRQLTDMDELWSDAIESAGARLDENANRLPRRLPAGCPLSFDELPAKTVDWDGVIGRLRIEGTNPLGL